MEPITFWIVLGVVLLILEVFTTSFYTMFFGLGALVTALFVYTDLAGDTTNQLITFAVASVASLLMFRKKLLRIFNKDHKEYREFVGDHAKVSTTIPEGGEGKVFYRGADWIARSASGQSIEKNTRVRIKKAEGIKLTVTTD